MKAETLAALMGLGGAVVGAGLSTGAVIWQQRKTAHEAERTHLLGLAEAAANEVIRLNYALQDHFAEDVVVDPFSSEYANWASRLDALNRLLEQQALMFADPEVRHFLEKVHTQIDRDRVSLLQGEEGTYISLCTSFWATMFGPSWKPCSGGNRSPRAFTFRTHRPRHDAPQRCTYGLTLRTTER